MNLSKRVKKIEESGIRKVFELSQKIGPEAIDLSIGKPHFNVPDYLKKEAIKAIESDQNSYLSSKGYEPLRKKLANKLKTVNKIPARADDIMISSGVSGAIQLLFAALLDEGDEVILPDPYFVLYKELLSFMGVKIVFHDTYPDFRLHPEKIEPLINNKTKLIIINSPNNPTGIVYDKNELEKLAQIAKKYNTLILSDEIYEEFDFEKKFFSIGIIYPNTITLNGFSKNLAITGWRLAYAHGPRELIAAMTKLQMYSYVCAPSIAQISVANIFENIQKPYDYKDNRDLLLKNLSKEYKVVRPEGAFYAYVKIPRQLDDFYTRLENEKLLVVPGEVFSRQSGYFRLSFATNKETLELGIKILNSLL